MKQNTSKLNKETIMKKDISISKLFFRKNCNGAMAAASAVYDKLPGSVTFMPIESGEFIDVNKDDELVVFIDYTLETDEIEEVLSKMHPEGRLVIIDHHETTISNIKEFLGREKNKKVSDRLIFLVYIYDCSATLGYRIEDIKDFYVSKEITDKGGLFTNLNLEKSIRPSVRHHTVLVYFYTLIDIYERSVTDEPEFKKPAEDLNAYLLSINWSSEPVRNNVKTLLTLTHDKLEEMIKIGSTLNKPKTNQVKSDIDKPTVNELHIDNSLMLDVLDKNGKLVKLTIVFTNKPIIDIDSLLPNVDNNDISIMVEVMILPNKKSAILVVNSNDKTSSEKFCEAYGGIVCDQTTVRESKILFNRTPNKIIEIIEKTISENEIVTC